MIKFYLISLILIFSFLEAKESTSLKENNQTTTFKIAKVNQHTISSAILGSKRANLLQDKYNKNKKKAIINQLINDEIAIQYAFNYLKLDDNISDEKKRLNYGLILINNIALKEVAKAISDESASKFYNENKKIFWHKKNYEASSILLKDKNQTKKLIKKLENSQDFNSTFRTLAKKYSIDKASKKGGYLGYFESKIMVKPFKEALEKLKIHSFTHTPIKTKFGYHIIWLQDIVQEGYIPFKQIKQDIKRTLSKDNKNEWFEKTLLPLKKKTKIKNYLDLIGKSDEISQAP